MSPRPRLSPQHHRAPSRNLALDDLNRDERKVHETLGAAGEPLKIREIARRTFKLRPTTYVADYRTRNALRRLVRERLIEQVARGSYQMLTHAVSRTGSMPGTSQSERPAA